ncbi:MAG: glycerol kinase GlpK [Candidatus Omnitrophica bacterium]|nr:glycerol kinase GlpK [Candidatus Omnitrophota bacterium]
MLDSRSSVLAIDQGTTGTRALLYDRHGRIQGGGYQEFRQHFPHPGWVEHDALEILHSTERVIQKALSEARISPSKIAAIGITNQRETTVLWERKTGRPIAKAIVWQDRRTSELCSNLKKRGLEPYFQDRTGLVLDPYFSGTKIKWLLDTIPGLRRRAAKSDVLFGTIDSWLLWNLTGGKVHATDATNASRTLLLNLKRKAWDRDILKLLHIPSTILPEVHPSAFSYGKTSKLGPLNAGIPICSLVGDQQAALYGQGCYGPGEMKNTYGTGCFLVMNQGKTYKRPSKGLLGTLACDKEGKPVYALEGSVFITGAAIQWLRDGLKLIQKASDTEKIARSIKDSGGVIVVPAFTGLGAPYWKPNVRGAILGLTRGTKREHLIRATLESIAYQVTDVFQAMVEVTRRNPKFLKVDGGAARNNYLMQFQADLLGVPVLRSDMTESTAWGAAKLAGVQCGFWKDVKVIDRVRHYKKFGPKMRVRERLEKLESWKSAVKRLL